MDHRIDRGDSLPGGYRVVDILRGGMGVVFICDQEATEQLWALKTFRPDGTPEETARLEQKFGDEVRNWVRISRERPSDHVVQALTFDADHRLLILEFVDGLPLHRLGPPDCPIHPRHVIGWARDIAAGMRLLHNEFQLIHRDLKPQNVLISRRNLTAKVTDLGIGKVAQDLGSPGTLVGTPAFMPPESFDGYADFRSDIYAFGATVSWMLSGEPTAAIQSPHADRLPEKLRELLVRCLARSPDDRYQVFDRLIQDLYDPTLDDLANFDVDESRYDFCETHNFFSPRAGEAHAPRCLFCEQARELSDRLYASREIAKKRSWQPPDEAHTDFLADEIATAKLARSDESSTAAASEPAAEGETSARAAESSARAGDAEAREHDDGTTAPWILRRRATLLVAALLALSVGAIFLGTRGGDEVEGETGSTSIDGERMRGAQGDDAANDSRASLPPRCAIAGCDRPVSASERPETSKGLASGCKPTLCAEHGAFECTSCGQRSAVPLSLDNLCVCCGAAVARPAR